MGYQIHKLGLRATRDAYLACANTRPLGLAKWFPELSQEIRNCIPDDGEIHSDIPVVVPQGSKHNAQVPHKHFEWTAIYYVDLGDPPCPILIDGIPVLPEPGDVVVLEPNTLHEVETSKSERERISFAMRVYPGGD